MFEHLKKIIFFLSLACSINLIAPAFSYAQKTDTEKLNEGIKKLNKLYEVQSTAEFAGEHGGKKYLPALTASPETSIICGNAETICNRETEYCLKCTVKTQSDGVYTKSEYGKCVAKEGYNISDKHASWPDDGNCLQKTKIFLGGFTIYAGVISEESSGFLSANTTDALFYHSVQGHTFSDSNGKMYQLFMTETPTIQYAGNKSGDDDTFNGCEVLPVKIYNHQSCFFCPLAGLIFGAANDVTSSSFASFTGPFKVVIVVVFAIWLALAALGQVFPMTKQDAPKFLASVLKQGFKFALAYFLLTYANDLFRLFIIPVLDGGLALGTHIRALELPNPVNWTKTEISTPEMYYNLKGEITGETLFDRIELFLASVQAQLSYMQAIGTTIFCVGGHEIITVHFDKLKIGLRMMLLGGVLTAFGFLLTIAFAFYFLDALLQLAVIGAMLPFMIAGWPFKVTAQYASTGFKMLLNTFFVMFFTGFVISVNIGLISQSLSLSTSIQADTKTTGASTKDAKENVNAFEDIIEAINDQNFEKLNKATDIGGVGFMLLAFSCIFGFKFVAQTAPLANTLASGGFKGGIAGKIGTMAASTVKGMAGKATAPIRQGIGAATGGVIGIAAGAAGGVVSGAGGLVSLVGKGASKVGDKIGDNMVGKGFSHVGKGASGLGKGISKVGSVGKKIQNAYKKDAAKG